MIERDDHDELIAVGGEIRRVNLEGARGDDLRGTATAQYDEDDGQNEKRRHEEQRQNEQGLSRGRVEAELAVGCEQARHSHRSHGHTILTLG